MRRDALRAVCSAGLFGLKLRDRRFFKIYIDEIKTETFKTLECISKHSRFSGKEQKYLH